jgi:hypothetical protein
MELARDTTFMNGLELQQICFGLYQIIFNFTNFCHIMIGSKLLFIDKQGQLHYWSGENGRAAICLNSIIEESVVASEFSKNQELKLSFSNGEILVFISEGVGESYVVHLYNDFEVIANI